MRNISPNDKITLVLNFTKMGYHRAGKKITGNHTSAIELAAEIVDFLEKQPEVTKISLGFITPKSTKSAVKIVKITPENNRCVLLKAIQKGTVQELRFYSEDVNQTIEALSQFVITSNWELNFKQNI